MNKPVAVIILNWNGEHLLREFLPDVIANTDQAIADIIVADNGSTDGSIALLQEHFPSVKIIRFTENYGFAEGYNRAIASTCYDYTVLLNSDVAPDHGWITTLLEYMQAHPDVAACQPKILSYRNPSQFEYAGASGGFLDRHGYPYCRGRIFSAIEHDHGQYDTPLQIFWATGAALMVRSQLYIDASGLDPDFFAHMEEIDLCCRMIGAGYRVMALTDATVYHVGGASLPKGNPKKTYLNFRNNLLLLHKNLPAWKGSRVLFIRRLADTLAFMMFLLKGQWGDARAILRAHRDFRRMRRNYTDLPDRDYMSTLPGAGRSILIDHYLRRRI